MSEERPGNEIFNLPADADPFGETVVTPEPKPVVAEPTKVEPQIVVEPLNPEPKGTEVLEVKTVETPNEPKTPKKVELADDDEVTILQDGKPVTVRWGDHKSGVMLRADYSRKTAALATERTKVTEAATQLQAREQKLLAIMGNKDEFRALAKQLHGEDFFGQPETPKPSTPASEEGGEEIVTKKDLAALKEQWTKEMQAEKLKDKETAQTEAQQAEVARFVQSIHTAAESTIDTIIKDPTVAVTLGRIPHVDRVLKAMAAEKNPVSPEEVSEAIKAAAKELHEELKKQTLESARAEALAPKGPAGIEPKGGAAPAQKEKTYTRVDAPHKVDWDAVDADVVNWLQGGGQ